MNNEEAMFWKEIKAEFKSICDVIREFDVPDEREVAAYQASQAKSGRIESALEKKIAYGHLYYPLKEDSKLDVESIMDMLGLPFCEGNEAGLTLAIKEAIGDRKLTGDFIQKWGKFNFFASHIISVIVSNETQVHFSQNIKNNYPNIWEKAVYSHWMKRKWIDGKLNRRQAEDELADKICRLIQEDHHPISDINILRSIIAKDGASVRRTYKDMKDTEILNIVSLDAPPFDKLPKALFQ